MNKYRCKVCGELFNVENAEVINSNKFGVIYKCPNCASGSVWGFVTKRGLANES